jgi:hypothetical protein
MPIARIATGDGPRTVVQHGQYPREVLDPFAHACPTLAAFAPVKPGDREVVTIDGIGQRSIPIRTSR